jgi:hypothetical protein
MFNEEERKEELNQTIYLSGDISCDDILDEIISQEKLMIEQIKKEAVKEFAEKLKSGHKYMNDVVSILDIDKLPKEYEAI